MASPSNRATLAPAYPNPAMRRLRIYAFDPHASLELDTAVINDATIELPWEKAWEDALSLGPVNDYLEVIDYDPACGLFYAPVDLNDPVLLAQNGLPPSEGRPQFHQQMVFAVAMRTVRIFERALGRPVMWTRARPPGADTDAFYGAPDSKFVKRLRIYPHALREANAYYSPEKCALLFGYFKKDSLDGRQDEGWVFTCLSQDIVAHETTHAILHGMMRRSIEPTSADALAFHEGFADVVALLQHFSMTNVVEHELGRARGDLRNAKLLNGLATQFGQATGRKGALRSALELIEREQRATPEERGKIPTLAETTEPHDRGQFLVAAVYDAFVTIYERRTADLMRLAGESIRGGEALSPDLVGRLATEARKASDHILRMCVRALDYIPPVDLQFGEYLRAIITADADLIPDDPMRYRVAIAEAFRKRGIFVPGALSMAPDSLMWDELDPNELPTMGAKLDSLFAKVLSRLQFSAEFGRKRQKPKRTGRGGDNQQFLTLTGYEQSDEAENFDDPVSQNLRIESMRIILENQRELHDWILEDDGFLLDWQMMLGLKLRHVVPVKDSSGEDLPPLIAPGGISSRTLPNGEEHPSIEVHSARVARRQGPEGQELHQLVIQVTQRRRAYFDTDVQAKADAGELARDSFEWKNPDFWFRGGATLLVDLRDGRLRRVIRKRIDKEERLKTERNYRMGGEGVVTLALGDRTQPREPFAFIHRRLR